MKKISRVKALWLFAAVTISAFLFSIWAWNTPMFNDVVCGNESHNIITNGNATTIESPITADSIEYGTYHYLVNCFNVILTILLIILFIVELVRFSEHYHYNPSLLRWCSYHATDINRQYSKNDDGDNNNENDVIKGFNPKKILLWGIGIILFFTLWSFCKTIYNGMKYMYNTSITYHNDYNQKVQEKSGFYDKMWKTYLQKDKITNVTRETFLMVTKIIMENRADGKTLTWKWVQENQQIPYNEFTAFYADLSYFIASQREQYFKIETDCQKIANGNNILLDTFPNNIYNRVLKCKKINFEYGMLSDSTLNVIGSKKENLK